MPFAGDRPRRHPVHAWPPGPDARPRDPARVVPPAAGAGCGVLLGPDHAHRPDEPLRGLGADEGGADGAHGEHAPPPRLPGPVVLPTGRPGAGAHLGRPRRRVRLDQRQAQRPPTGVPPVQLQGPAREGCAASGAGRGTADRGRTARAGERVHPRGQRGRGQPRPLRSRSTQGRTTRRASDARSRLGGSSGLSTPGSGGPPPGRSRRRWGRCGRRGLPGCATCGGP
jgi:hypothetical protein